LIGDDIQNIAGFLGITEKTLRKKYLVERELFNTKLLRPKLKTRDKPYGKCVFLGDNKCQVHQVKPLQCRTGNCSKHGEELGIWFMLNYLVNKADAESIRQYEAYLNSGGKTIEGGKLEEIVPDKARLDKILSFEKLK